MQFIDIVRWLKGYITVEASGKFPERFLNLMLNKEVPIWEPIGQKGKLRFKVYAREYKKLKPLARRSQVKIKSSKKKGLPFFIKRNKKRKGLLIGLVLFAGLIILLSQFVWEIEISNLSNFSYVEVKNILKEEGLEIGVLKNDLNIEKIERNATLKLEDIAWITVNIIGNTAKVEISESETPKTEEDKKMPCNIKASKDGQIIRMDISQGQKAVNIGDGVVEGQLVVSGVVQIGEEILNLVHSEAKVLAKTTHQKTIEIPLNQEVSIPTGKFLQRKQIDFFGIKLPTNFLNIPSEDYKEVERTNQLNLNNQNLPIYEVQENWYEFESAVIKLNEENAKKIADDKLLLYETFNLNHCEEIEKVITTEIKNDTLIVTAKYTCIEDIAVKSEILLE